MQPENSGRAVDEWRSLVESIPANVRVLIGEMCAGHAAGLADEFYAALLAHPEAQRYLSHDIVNTRLRRSLRGWLNTLLDLRVVAAEGGDRVVALQRHVGAMHARIGLGHHLVLRGARVLKQHAAQHLLANESAAMQDRISAALATATLIDFAMELMTAEYVSASDRTTRADEAYRVFAKTANMSLERERQRAALLDWQSKLLQAMLWAAPGDRLEPLEAAPFGLWVHHKASAIFGSADLGPLVESIQRIDNTLLPLCVQQIGEPDSAEARRMLREVLREVGQIRYVLDQLFEQMVDLEAGRDVLTQLLNRRYLPGVLSREMEFSTRSNRQFALLLVDIDHFKNINDAHGHASGDRVLQQVAALLSNSVRAGDFLFRYGGEEFLIVTVELDRNAAFQIADALRRKVEESTYLLERGGVAQVTVSIGVAVFDGHPDYQRLIDQADAALYRAKQSGRNRCVVA